MAGGGGSGDSGEFGLQIAPMLDVMFVLMLFFMVMAGSQRTELEMGIDLPSVGGSKQNQDKPPAPIYLKVDFKNQVYFNDQPVDTPKEKNLKGLVERLKKAIVQYGTKTPIIVIPEDKVPHKRVVDVMNACSEADVKNLSFGVSSTY